MASAFRSHFKAPARQTPDTSPNLNRKPSSRIPIKPESSESKSNRPAGQIPRLVKKANRSLTSPEKAPTPTTARVDFHGSQGRSKPTGYRIDSHPASDRTREPMRDSSRNQTISQNSLQPPPSTRTPSLVSGSSVSTFDSPRSVGLRRKPSSVGHHGAQAELEKAAVRADRSDVQVQAERYHESVFDETVLGISLPKPTTQPRRYEINRTPVERTAPSSRHSVEMRTWTNAANEIVPSSSSISQITTPSTRYTDSPFSHAPTPSSVSSCSSNIPATAHLHRVRSPQSPPSVKSSQTQERLERRISRPPLAPVRETSRSSTSSSNQTRLSSSRRLPPASSPPTVAPHRVRDRSPPPVAFNQTPPLQPLRTVPPEFAHLAVDHPRRPSIDRVLPPSRPSREGTADLTDLGTPAPVVHVDLPRLHTTYQRRVSSQDLQTPLLSPALSSRFGASSRASSRGTADSPRIDSAISPPPSSKGAVAQRKSDAPPRERRVLRKDSPAISTAPSPSKISSRFGIFSRKSKSEGGAEIKISDKPKRTLAKGPAAGTGHEGYGRFGIRPRGSSFSSNADTMSSSVESSTSGPKRPQIKRNQSLGSNTSEAELDDFLRARLTPVVLRGSASSMASESSVGPSATEVRASSHFESSTTSSVDSYPRLQLLPSAMQDEHSSTSSTDPREKPSHLPTHHISKATRTETTHDLEPLTDASLYQTQRAVEGGEGLWLRPEQLGSPSLPAYKWNFFQRAMQKRPQSPGKTVTHASTSSQHRLQPVAHYALNDSDESIALADVQQVLAENAKFHPEMHSDYDSPEPLSGDTYEHERYQHGFSEATLPAPDNHALQGVDQNISPRLPRLSSVGRIPRVVSKRDRDRQLPANSFSRPFARNQPHPNVKPPGVLYNSIRELASPLDTPIQLEMNETPGRSNIQAANDTNVPSIHNSRTSDGLCSPTELFITYTRKDSDFSYSSSHKSWLAALATQPPQQDDPWVEYNDLIDDMMPLRTPVSAGSSHGAPFQYSSLLSGYDSSMPMPLRAQQPPPSAQLPVPPRSVIGVQPALSVPQQIARFMQPSLSPLTPHAADMLYLGDRNSTVSSAGSRSSAARMLSSSLHRPSRTSLSSSQGGGLRHSRGSIHSRSASLPEANIRDSQNSVLSNVRLKRDHQLLKISEDETSSKINTAGLRYGALMTSRWLSFGRVLFSPAHNEMKFTEQPRVLIIDGLGTDWSFYVALSYPTATVYNLGPSKASDSPTQTASGPAPPPNHRQIPHASMHAAFPFPRGFFTAVVFRFPIATSEEAYHACILECKRVLRPGGYLEVTVLDLDLMNMGQRARRAVRNLKIAMQKDDCNVDLSNLSDLLIRLIGRRGFEDVQRCMVGVPAAGCVPGSEDNSSVASEDALNSHSAAERRQSRIRSRNFDFTDLLQESRTSQFDAGKQNDEGITKMVANVGRWWYSTCYESAVTNDDGHSIWNDNSLLRECEKQGTSFRLLICHAQKPMQTRRRTVSV